MQEPSQDRSLPRKRLFLLVKIIITGVCLWYVSTRIDFRAAGEALKNAEPLSLLGALGLYIFSKVLSSFRLNINFRNIGILIPEKENLRLYWLGMFYNLFLPGSISGDAYKVIILSKRFGRPYKKTTAAVLLDRFSGLAGLGLILAVYGLFVLEDARWKILLVAAAVFSVLLLYLTIKKWLPDFLPGFPATLLLGIAVQLIQVMAVYLIMLSLDIPPGTHEYIFLFLLSSVASVLPLTIGGLGLREIVFLQGSLYLGLEQETAVLLSLIFFFITVIASAFGLYYIFREPLKKKT